MTSLSPKINNQGFSLIEVMLAVLILAGGILAVSKLQTSLIRSGADANQRSVAASLAQKKMDDLRRFVHLTATTANGAAATWDTDITSPLSLTYDHIGTDTGGLIAPANVTISNTEYGLSWTVNDYYYADTNEKATTTDTGNQPNFKTVHVVVSWDSVGSLNNVVSFDTVIDAYGPTLTALGNNPSSGNAGPVVPYTPQPQPDVVPITISEDGVKRETSKPLLELSRKGDSTLVTFEAVTYTNSLSTVKREEFRTIACKCKTGTGTPDDDKIYGLTTWDPVEEKLIDVTYTKVVDAAKTLVDNSGGEDQVNECFICCRDAEDVTEGNTAFKVCRTKRIDGITRLFKSWKLVAFNAIPQSYFEDNNSPVPEMTTILQGENISTYSSYVTSLIRGYLTINTTELKFDDSTAVDTLFKTPASDFVNSTTTDHTKFVVGGDSRDIQARGVYLDYPPDGIYTTQVIDGSEVTYTPANVPLDRIPFFEVNLTELAGWVPDIRRYTDDGAPGDLSFITTYTDQHDVAGTAPGCASPTINNRHSVSNDELKTGCENKFSRGTFTPQSVGTYDDAIDVETRIYTNDDGVVNRTINANNPFADSSVNITVDK